MKAVYVEADKTPFGCSNKTVPRDRDPQNIAIEDYQQSVRAPQCGGPTTLPSIRDVRKCVTSAYFVGKSIGAKNNILQPVVCPLDTEAGPDLISK